MQTTIDIPEDLLRQAEAQAALRGMQLKEFVSEAIKSALTKAVNLDQVQLGDDCIFPIIRGDCGPVMRVLTSEKIHEILETEDSERAFNPGGC